MDPLRLSFTFGSGGNRGRPVGNTLFPLQPRRCMVMVYPPSGIHLMPLFDAAAAAVYGGGSGVSLYIGGGLELALHEWHLRNASYGAPPLPPRQVVRFVYLGFPMRPPASNDNALVMDVRVRNSGVRFGSYRQVATRWIPIIATHHFFPPALLSTGLDFPTGAPRAVSSYTDPLVTIMPPSAQAQPSYIIQPAGATISVAATPNQSMSPRQLAETELPVHQSSTPPVVTPSFEWPPTVEEDAVFALQLYGPATGARRHRRLLVFEDICPADAE